MAGAVTRRQVSTERTWPADAARQPYARRHSGQMAQALLDCIGLQVTDPAGARSHREPYSERTTGFEPATLTLAR